MFVLTILFYSSSAFANEIDAMKNDAAKKALCSMNNPCSINIKGHNGTYVVKVNSATITKNGILNINHYQFKRYVYFSTGKFSHEINSK